MSDEFLADEAGTEVVETTVTVPHTVIDLHIFAALTPKQQQFLNTFPIYGVIGKTATAVKITPQAVYRWIATQPSFCNIFQQVRALLKHLMEDAAVSRSVYGVKEDIFYKGEVVGEKTNFSDSLLMFMLRAADPGTYREKSSLDLYTKTEEPGNGMLGDLSKDALAEIHRVIAADAAKRRLIEGNQ